MLMRQDNYFIGVWPPSKILHADWKQLFFSGTQKRNNYAETRDIPERAGIIHRNQARGMITQ
jgi:hypothetical protein